MKTMSFCVGLIIPTPRTFLHLSARLSLSLWICHLRSKSSTATASPHRNNLASIVVPSPYTNRFPVVM
ncbi:hypothetical protein SDJN03_25120, partial [Cucurbita argyrosperma subsp. sororia]